MLAKLGINNDIFKSVVDPFNIVYHKGCKCWKCGKEPIVNVRYTCTVCQNLHLCEDCEFKPDSHSLTHPMVKLRKPEFEEFIEAYKPVN
jgi:hypothetical protein